MKQKLYLRSWLLMLLSILAITSKAQSVNISEYSSSGTENGYPLFYVAPGEVTVSSTSGTFDSVLIDDHQVAYNSSGYWTSYNIDLSTYIDGISHKLQLKRSSSNYGICYFKVDLDESNLKDGLYFLINGENATVIGAIYDIESAIIPETFIKEGSSYPVTQIGKNAFYGKTKLTSVTVPNSVISIENSAFYGCSGLTSINIPQSVLKIGVQAFNGCTALKTVTFSDGENAVELGYNTYNSSATGKGLFSDCPIETLYIGRAYTITDYNSSYPQRCGYSPFPSTVLTLTIGNHVTSIPAYFLYNGNQIESLTIPNSVTSIGAYAFRNSSKLKSIVIPSQITSVGSNAFSNCSSLVKTAYPSSIPNPFSYGINISYPSSGITDEYNVIYDADKTQVYFAPLSLESSYVIPNSVTTIGYSAFYGCSGLTSVNIPQSVLKIGVQAFNGCTALKAVTFSDSENAVELGYNTYNSSGTGKGLFYDCPIETLYVGRLYTITNYSSSYSYNSYPQRYGYSPFPSTVSTLTIGNNVTSIPAYFLYNGSQIESLTIPNSVTTIGTYAFRSSSKLKSVVIPFLVTSVGSYAFSNCSLLVKTAYPSSIPNPFSYGINISYPSSGITDEYDVIYDSDKTQVYFAPLSLESSYVIPNSITTIGNSAFYGCTGMTSLTIPQGVTNIGNSAFSGTELTALEFNAQNCTTCGSSSYPAFPSTISTLTIGNNVTSIPAYFLYNGSQLESLTIPNSVTTIGNSAFYGCSGLTSVTIPQDVTNIGTSAFSDTGLTALVFNAQNCTTCGSSSSPAFPSTISTLTIGNNVTSIPAYFLYNGSQIESLTIPNSVTSIGNSAFYGCSGLTSLTIPQGVTNIGNSAFSGTGLTTLEFNAKNCTTCGASGYSAFPSTISTLTIGNNVTSIPAYFLYNGSQIESLTIPNSVTSIGYGAFLNSNSKLKSLTIGSGLLSIGDYAFSTRTSSSYQYTIPKVFWMGNTPPTGYNNIKASVNYVANDQYSLNNQLKYQFLSSKFSVDGTVYIPVSPSERTCDIVDCEYVQDYSEISLTDKVSNRGVEMSVLNINQYSFYNNDYITSLNISNKGEIGNNAFYDCDLLESVQTTNTGNIGSQTFYGCDNLQIATIQNTGNIGSQAFYNSKNLNSAILGDKVNGILAECFYGCSALTQFTIPNSVVELGTSAFRNCSSIETVVIGTALPSLPTYVFAGCSSLNSLILPNNIGSIGNYAFSGCSSLGDVTMEEADSEDDFLVLGSNGSNPLFSDCPLDDVYIGRKLSYNTSSSYGYSPFYRNTSLRTVEIMDAETQIYDNEFYGCTNLSSLKIGNGVKTIGDWAFSGCSSLDYFSAGYNVESIGKEAFSDCTGLTKYYSYSIVPPVCGDQALDDINKWDCTLYVPDESSDEYQAAPQWKEFFFIEEMDAVLVAELRLNVEEVVLAEGEFVQLSVEILPSNATNQDVEWISSNDTVATVSETGFVTALSGGEAVITVRSLDGNAEASCIIMVQTDTNVNQIYSDQEDVEVYNLNGYKVAETVENLTPGVYIVRKGNKAHKILVK